LPVPVGLNPGDPYRLIFVTSIARDALSTNIADYNSFVHGIANGPTSEFQSLGTT